MIEKFDHIFFTGGTAIGRIVMAAAAKHLTPVTLELGGKSPCIVDADINLDHAAKRIAWGKFINAGQTCIAPDYLLIEHSIKEAFLAKLTAAMGEFFGDDPSQSPDLSRIINQRQFDRLTGLLDAFSEPTFRKVLSQHIDEGPSNAILDLSGIDFVDSSGLGALVQLVKKAKEANGTVQVIANPRVMQTVKLVRLEKFLSVQASVDDAIANLSTPD